MTKDDEYEKIKREQPELVKRYLEPEEDENNEFENTGKKPTRDELIKKYGNNYTEEESETGYEENENDESNERIERLENEVRALTKELEALQVANKKIMQELAARGEPVNNNNEKNILKGLEIGAGVLIGLGITGGKLFSKGTKSAVKSGKEMVKTIKGKAVNTKIIKGFSKIKKDFSSKENLQLKINQIKNSINAKKIKIKKTAKAKVKRKKDTVIKSIKGVKKQIKGKYIAVKNEANNKVQSVKTEIDKKKKKVLNFANQAKQRYEQRKNDTIIGALKVGKELSESILSKIEGKLQSRQEMVLNQQQKAEEIKTQESEENESPIVE